MPCQLSGLYLIWAPKIILCDCSVSVESCFTVCHLSVNVTELVNIDANCNCIFSSEISKIVVVLLFSTSWSVTLH